MFGYIIVVALTLYVLVSAVWNGVARVVTRTRPASNRGRDLR
ncbi:hypothetical protein ACOACO_16855 [Nocardioides sp. CPCC 205120]